jgi:hypothetical protein
MRGDSHDLAYRSSMRRSGGKMPNGCQRLREPAWALPFVAGCGVISVVGAGIT